ncbi:MAG: hypothetical protein H0U59_00930 [Gemmatimonadaceae bacterium]|nr:hypothetical protein [Gemmatimonadaceae bacterium]
MILETVSGGPMAMDLQYQSSPAGKRDAEGVFYLLVLKSLAGYLAVSTITIPFLKAIWLGELPLLALIQVPKISMANWIRVDVVMRAINWLGLSSGSFSPDYGRARPYGLAIAYLVPLAIVSGVVWVRTRMQQPYRRWTCVLLGAAVVDYAMTMIFADGPSVSMY